MFAELIAECRCVFEATEAEKELTNKMKAACKSSLAAKTPEDHDHAGSLWHELKGHSLAGGLAAAMVKHHQNRAYGGDSKSPMDQGLHSK